MADFKQTQDDWDRTQWQGTGFVTESPGGGNPDNDEDTDPIDRMRPGPGTIVGPKGPLDQGNK